MAKKGRREDLMTECSCGAMSYIDGWCFECGRFRPSKPARFVEERDMAEHGRVVVGPRLAAGRRIGGVDGGERWL